MMLRKWDDLPDEMHVDEVRPYFDVIYKKKVTLFFKRMFDLVISLVMLIMLSPIYLVLAIAIKADSKGPVFYRQVRVTQYGKQFRIHKFRTMCDGADKKGTLVTVGKDSRITNVGKLIRKCRLDEIGQLIDVFEGNMTFVGVRPEVPRYVNEYTKEMMATLLLPAGVTNLTCIYYKDEDELLSAADNPDREYIDAILPAKMKLNLQGMLDFSFLNDIKIMFMTFFAVLGKEYRMEKDNASAHC